ncbi:WapI family immunity protein [Demequina sp.]|uniref:WapI family immunity protein n=1 Tax=Demequina sp. TaxID=2050685 RepID=UPI003D14038D
MTVEFVLGNAPDDCIAVEVLRLEHPGTEGHDAEWLVCTATLVAGGFRAAITGSLWASDFRYLREGLERLYRELAGSAEIKALEAWFDLTVRCLPNGALQARVRVADPLQFDRELTADLRDLDQSHLPSAIEQLRAIEGAFPPPAHR